MKKSFLLILVFILLNHLTYSQSNNIWFFGRKVGLNFNPVVGQQVPTLVSTNVMVADEASASICDKDGKLLFYTNGKTVYNSNHQVMINGDNLDGEISAAQTAIIPKPGSDNLYYIFTTGSIEAGFAKGYRYSIVDMTLDNGLGEITQKNNTLWASACERMTAIRHANGIDVWLVTNDKYSNTFRSWLINCNGLQPAVVSTVGRVLNEHINMDVGTLKASPDGSRICQTHFPIFDEFNRIPNFFQLFDFNNITGILSNPFTVEFSDAQFTHSTFSSNSKMLYVSRPYDKKIDQFNISLPTASIPGSRVVISTNARYFDLQLAPDEKIYLSNINGDLGAINLPNLQGVNCDLQERVLIPSPGSAFIGLPSVINDIVTASDPNNGFNYTILDSCTGVVQFSGYSILSPAISWLWDFGDGTTSTSQNPLHQFSDPLQVYKVKLEISSTTTCGTISRSRIILPSGLTSTTAEFAFLNNCDSGYVRFINQSNTLPQPNVTYQWDFGDGNSSTVSHPIHSYSSSGSYTVKLKINSGASCIDDSITHNVDFTTFSINTLPDRVINYGESVTLTTNGPLDANYIWTPVKWLNDANIQSPVAKPDETTVYKVIATDAQNCKSEDSVKITVIVPEDIDDIYVPTAFTPNNDGKNDKIRPFIPRKYILEEYSIYNRGGQRIFTTSNREEGWNGTISGVMQSPGVFIWVLSVTDNEGNKIFKKGNLVLIR